MHDDTHTTLGVRFRTPAHPEVLIALGRVHYNFLSLDESVSAVLFESGEYELGDVRGRMAGKKLEALNELAGKYADSGLNDVSNAITTAADAYKRAKDTVRNKVSHAHPYTAGKDEHGNFLPGLGYTTRSGKYESSIAEGPADLLELALEVELVSEPMNTARLAVRAHKIENANGTE